MIGLVDGSTGARSATYVYGPFGESVAAFGPAVGSNPFRFSTKYQDAETGIYYYGYRWYCPFTGRFLSKDPIGERGGVNLYGIVGNNPANDVDALGLWEIEFVHCSDDHLSVEANHDAGGGNMQFRDDYPWWATGGTSTPQAWAGGARSPLFPPLAASEKNSISIGVSGYTNFARWGGRKLSNIQWSGELVYDVYVIPEATEKLVCSAKFTIDTRSSLIIDPGVLYGGGKSGHAYITLQAGPDLGKKIGLIINPFTAFQSFNFEHFESHSLPADGRTRIATIDVGFAWQQYSGNSIIANAQSVINVEAK